MKKYNTNRIISTPTAYAKEHYLYVQETGTLQSIEPHISKREHLKSFLFFIVLEGSGQLSLQGKSYKIQSGDCIFLSCLEEYSHESSREDPWKLSWVHFYGKEAEEIYRHFREQGGNFIFHPQETEPFYTTLAYLYQELLEKNTYYEQKCHKLLTDLITFCYLEIQNSGNTNTKTDFRKILAVRVYLDENYNRNISLDYLSSEFFISKFHLSREFKKLTGMTIMNYLNSRRVVEAKKLLRFTDRSVSEIANACGIPDFNYFSKVFAKYESMTPSSYRKLWR